MAKPDPAVDLDQPGRLRRLERRRVDREPLRPPATAGPDRRLAPRLPAASSRRVSSGSASSRRRKLFSIRAGQRQRAGQPEAARQLRRASPRGSSNNASGFPRVSAITWSATRLSSRPGTTEAKQRACIGIPQPLDQQLRAGRRARSLGSACSEQHDHRLRQQPARHERQRLRRRPVQPLRVIDHAHQRALLRRLGQQAKHRQADEEPVRHGARHSARTWSQARRAADPGARSSRSSSGAHS